MLGLAAQAEAYASGAGHVATAVKAVLATPDDVQEWEDPDGQLEETTVVTVARVNAALTQASREVPS